MTYLIEKGNKWHGKFPKESKYKRSRPYLDPKQTIYIICEGEVTEPKYIEHFSRDKKHDLVKVVPFPKSGVPITIVNKAVEIKKEIKHKIRKSGNSFDEKYEVWAMFDVDEHPKIAEATDKAKSNGILCCISNPCFELWGFLHFKEQNAYIELHEMQKALSKIMPGYDHNSNPIFNYEIMKGSYSVAKKQAQVLIKRHEAIGEAGTNPSTNVFELLDHISEGWGKQ